VNITVFGSGRPVASDADYNAAQELGAMIARAGHTVLTGGYVGTMEAVSRGANEAGGHVIGVTAEVIERYRPGGANPWVIEERRYSTLFERLQGMIYGCDAAIALPGGPGTFTEITLYWNLLVINAMEPKPLVLIGEGWRRVFSEYRATLGSYAKENDWRWLNFAADNQSALELAVNHPIA
jgi:uncharacterized protein (TIGR00730 family)